MLSSKWNICNVMQWMRSMKGGKRARKRLEKFNITTFDRWFEETKGEKFGGRIWRIGRQNSKEANWGFKAKRWLISYSSTVSEEKKNKKTTQAYCMKPCKCHFKNLNDFTSHVTLNTVLQMQPVEGEIWLKGNVKADGKMGKWPIPLNKKTPPSEKNTFS